MTPIELVFIHGWGLDAHFWDALAEKLSQFRQSRVDLGFLSAQLTDKAGGIPSPLWGGLGWGERSEGSSQNSKDSSGGTPPLLTSPSRGEEHHRSRRARNPSNVQYILIGHSLGFVHGIKQSHDWAGWIVINSFPRFVATQAKAGCTSAADLRGMYKRLQANPEKTLQDFYQFIGARPPTGTPNAERLREGLDELRDIDVEDTIVALDVPGLVLAGRNDPLVPVATSEALGRMAKQGSLVLHEEGGHALPQSAPDWCASAIANFITACFDQS